MQVYAKQSFQNLYIVTLDYLKLRRSGDRLSHVVSCDNVEVTDAIHKKGLGMVLLTAHMSNWEVPHLEGSRRMSGMMVAQRFFVESLADWVDSIRTQYGGITVVPSEAVTKGMRALRDGQSVGVAGDQALPEGSHFYDFFGTRAWTTLTPAIWAYRTNTPIVLVLARRENSRYITHYSEPIWPDTTAPFKQEVHRLMGQALLYLEQIIAERPGEYLWLHNRWCQDVYSGIDKRFQHDFILVILPDKVDVAARVWSQLPVFEELYPRAFITLMKPTELDIEPVLVSSKGGLQIEVVNYTTLDEPLERNWKYQMVFNFSDSKKVRRHFLKLSAYQVLDLPVTSENVNCIATITRRTVKVES